MGGAPQGRFHQNGPGWAKKALTLARARCTNLVLFLHGAAGAERLAASDGSLQVDALAWQKMKQQHIKKQCSHPAPASPLYPGVQASIVVRLPPWSSLQLGAGRTRWLCVLSGGGEEAASRVGRGVHMGNIRPR